MSLDLTHTALQIDHMSENIKNHRQTHINKIAKALDKIDSFDFKHHESRIENSLGMFNWNIPKISLGSFDKFNSSDFPKDYYVIATDGSHIDVDRHIPANCYLINIGSCILKYGNNSFATLNSIPKLYAEYDDLIISDRENQNKSVLVRGAILSAKRMLEELRALTKLVKEIDSDIPVLALMDGSLIMLDLIGQTHPEFIKKELVQNGFVECLDELYEISKQKKLLLASYISLPKSSEVVNSLRISNCSFSEIHCDLNCSKIAPGDRSCDEVSNEIIDREVFSKYLNIGERSGTFQIDIDLVNDYYLDNKIHYFYLNTGEEIARVEIPKWVVEREDLLTLTHTLILNQCKLGHGYPVSLIEAHEQAVVTSSDRNHFAQMVEATLNEHGMSTYTSEKNLSKRLRWV